MSEQEHASQLSALFDGELPPQQAKMVTRRVLRDAGLRQSWERYALIGACLRGDPVSAGHSVAERVQASLASERELNVSSLPVRFNPSGASASPRTLLFGRGALGGAIAAGVAVVSILVVRAVMPVASDDAALLAQGATPVALAADASATLPVGYTTPGANAPAQRRMVDASLGHFLVAHSEEAASSLRYSYDGTAAGAKLTEDLISALR
jgi:negative regulator of sigma E activity